MQDRGCYYTSLQMQIGPVARLGPWPVGPRRPRRGPWRLAPSALGAVGRPALALSLSLTLYCNTAVYGLETHRTCRSLIWPVHGPMVPLPTADDFER